MATRQIPKEQWERYFDSLSNQAHARCQSSHDACAKVSVTVEGEELGVETVAENAPLRGLFYDQKGSEGDSFDLEVGDDVSGARLVQRTLQAQNVWVEEGVGGKPRAIDIEGIDRASKARIKTIIRFES